MQNDLSAALSLPFILPAQAQKHVSYNEAIQRLDTIVQLAVISRGLSTPPMTAQTGDRYLLPGASSGPWAGQGGKVALWDGVSWQFITPRPGWMTVVIDENTLLVFDGQAWAHPDVIPQILPELGIATSPDATNRLAVASDATLLTHDQAGHQLKINKATSSDTASLLFQTGFSGHAEMGTAGSDDFAVKVSADGSIWHDGIILDRATGNATVKALAATSMQVNGTEVYRRGNIVGTVSGSVGVPTGAIIERGSNANGSFTRFADGTQICTFTTPGVSTTQASGSIWRTAPGETYSWTYPAAFSVAPVVGGSAGSQSRWLLCGQPTESLVIMRAGSPINDSALSPLTVSAIGRWF